MISHVKSDCKLWQNAVALSSCRYVPQPSLHGSVKSANKYGTVLTSRYWSRICESDSCLLPAIEVTYAATRPRHKRVGYILDLVEKRSLYVKFLESVRSETTHLGHGYVKALLQGTYYCSDDDLHKAADIRRKVESNLSRTMDIDLPSLVPFLCSQFLLTKDEKTLLTTKSEVQNQNVLQFWTRRVH